MPRAARPHRGQDVEPGESPGSWRIARKVAKDRVISTVDPEARHGHKSVGGADRRLQGPPRSEPDTGIVTAVKVTPANDPDGPAGVALMAGEPDGLEVLADSAYGSGTTRTELKDQPPPRHQAAALPPGRSRRARPRRLRRRPRRPHRHLPGRPHRPALVRWRREVRPALLDLPAAGPLHEGQSPQLHRRANDAELVAAREPRGATTS